jgi:hypothetical protein
MSKRKSFAGWHSGRSLGLIMSLFGMIMLLSFPFRSGHDFHPHFRTARIRRSVVSHTFVSSAPEAPAKTISQSPIYPAGFRLVDSASALEAPTGHKLRALVPASRFRRPFRPRRARASGDDPLI